MDLNIGMNRKVALALASGDDESLWRGLLESQGVVAMPLDASLSNCAALVADVSVLAARGLSPAGAARWLQASHPSVRLLVRVPARVGFSAAEREWARARGIDSLLPGGTVAAWQESVEPMAERILAVAGLGAVDRAALERHVKDLVKRGVEPRRSLARDIFSDAFTLRSQGIDPIATFEDMQLPGGVPVEDRTFRGRDYRACFVASEALDWLAQRHGMRRPLAESLCRFLWRSGRIHHVLRDAPFADDYLFFRFAGTRAQTGRVDLVRLEDDLDAAGGLAIADRTWRGRTFPRCFVGSEAVEWIMRREGIAFGAAEAVGQALLELGVLRHVAGEHDFMGEDYFYRLTAHEGAVAREAAVP